MKNVIFICLLFSLLLISCSSYYPPEHYKVTNEITLNQGYDEVWSKIIEYCTETDRIIKNIDKNAGYLSYFIPVEYNNKYKCPLDCGRFISGFHTDYSSQQYPTTVTVNIIVSKVGSQTSVKVKLSSYLSNESLKWDSMIEPHCNSTGIVENDIFKYLQD
ncbi:MAG TPA: hypothetical protein PKY56_11410 [Candidatus Kapabacteria bacterium]|nr:hypothetical protein [Candidatus Kapabacteria bacterium]HPO62434.1 hypothetical protein [Candidatus Kapabacteria bacterium]